MIDNLKFAYGVIRNPEKILDRMKKSGFEMDLETGEVYFYGVDSRGNYTPMGIRKSGSDIDKAVKQQEHILDSLVENTVVYSELDGIVNNVIDCVSKKDYNQATTTIKAVMTNYIFSRARDPYKLQVNDLINKINGIEVDKNPRAVEKLCKYLKDKTSQMVEKWQAQAEAIRKRSQVLLGIRNMIRKTPNLFMQLKQELES